MIEKIIIAGSGGQGNLFLGELLCLAAIIEGKNATWIPSYGPQMRGGKSICTVVISDEEIGSPIVAHPDVLIVMNKPSLDYLESMKPGSVVIINQSLAEYNGSRPDLDVVLVPIEEFLRELGNPKVANMILLGVYAKKRNILKIESIMEALKEKFSKKADGDEIIELNRKAFMLGYEFVK